MTHRHEERLDETIDRVAAHLTMVPADPGLAGRIAAQLEREPRFAWPRLAMASVAVAAVVAAFVFVNNARQAPAVDVAHHATTSPKADEPAQQPADVASARMSPAPSNTATVARRAVGIALPSAEDLLPEMPQLASLASPVTIDVMVLPTDTLTIEPVDFAPLDVADLAVRDIDEGDSPKE
jgi:hypothetical protein